MQSTGPSPPMTIMPQSSRKVVHYLFATSLVLLAFAVQTGCSRCHRHHNSSSSSTSTSGPKAWRALDVRLVTSATFAFVLCLMKQVGDALSLTWLPWCHLFSGDYCHFEWLDLFLTVDGVLTGLLLLIGLHICSNRCYRPAPPDIPCDPTVAMSFDDGDAATDDHRDLDEDDPEGVFDLTLTDFDDDQGDDHVVLPYHDGVDQQDVHAQKVLAVNDDATPELNASPNSAHENDPVVGAAHGTMFATLSSSPGSTSRMPLIFPSEVITV